MTPDAWLVVVALVVGGWLAWAYWQSRTPEQRDELDFDLAELKAKVRPHKRGDLFDVHGRRRPPGVQPAHPMPQMTGAKRAVVRAVGTPNGARRRSRPGAPCWICGGPRRADCPHCQQKGTGP